MPANILVVEDNAESREMLVVVLGEQGFKVKGAEDGRAALELIKSTRPDLIITDIQMPNLDGVGLIKELRKQPEMMDVPILIFSGCRDEMLSDAMRAGANAAAHKPLLLDSLIRLVKSLLTAVTLILLSFLCCLNSATLSV
ncbi:MAG TPA: response regulator [Blastocatellia bacterium]|jgi:two-component system chemotaxis response regulator CheY